MVLCSNTTHTHTHYKIFKLLQYLQM